MAKYQPSERLSAQIARSFVYHAPKDDQAERYEAGRDLFGRLARWCAENAPESRELSLAVTALEEANMWFNAAIARNEI